jgi:hypothetical protein
LDIGYITISLAVNAGSSPSPSASVIFEHPSRHCTIVQNRKGSFSIAHYREPCQKELSLIAKPQHCSTSEFIWSIEAVSKIKSKIDAMQYQVDKSAWKGALSTRIKISG